MQTMPSHTPSTLILERILVACGMVVCMIVTVLVWWIISPQQSMWPLPALYLLEMLTACILGLWSIWGNTAGVSPLRGILAWVVIGILIAFVIMGSFSVGLWFAPVAGFFAVAAILSDRRQGGKLGLHLGVGLAAALAQATLMLIVIRLLYP